ncbi:MAG: AAA family ATPase [Actinomycetota bacterium]
MTDHLRDESIAIDGVVIVSGPPGSGKSTVSALLASGFERGVHIESDWFYRSICSGLIAPHLSAAHEQNTAIMDIATDTAAGFADAGYTVVWDGIVGPWFLDRVAQRLRSRDVALRYLVLRTDRSTALDRVRQRDGTTETSGAEKMWDQFADLGDLQSHAVSAAGAVDEVVERCRRALGGDALNVIV